MPELGCTVTHLALAWLAANPNTSTVILGATRPEQVLDNLKALDVIPKMTPDILEKIEKILENKPEPFVRLVPLFSRFGIRRLIVVVLARQSTYGRGPLDPVGRSIPMLF